VEFGRKEVNGEAAQVLRIGPNFFLERWTRILVYKEQAEIDRTVNRLRKAGVK